MARGTWGSIKTYSFEKIQPVYVTDYFGATPHEGYAARVEIHSIPYKDQMPKRNLCRFAKLILPTGGLNAFSAKELREFAAKLIEAADQLDDAETWFGQK
jgi:hypothetical protein